MNKSKRNKKFQNPPYLAWSLVKEGLRMGGLKGQFMIPLASDKATTAYLAGSSFATGMGIGM